MKKIRSFKATQNPEVVEKLFGKRDARKRTVKKILESLDEDDLILEGKKFTKRKKKCI
jgi:hypothetical protein